MKYISIIIVSLVVASAVRADLISIPADDGQISSLFFNRAWFVSFQPGELNYGLENGTGVVTESSDFGDITNFRIEIDGGEFSVGADDVSAVVSSNVIGPVGEFNTIWALADVSGSGTFSVGWNYNDTSVPLTVDVEGPGGDFYGFQKSDGSSFTDLTIVDGNILFSGTQAQSYDWLVFATNQAIVPEQGVSKLLLLGLVIIGVACRRHRR